MRQVFLPNAVELAAVGYNEFIEYVDVAYTTDFEGAIYNGLIMEL